MIDNLLKKKKKTLKFSTHMTCGRDIITPQTASPLVVLVDHIH